MIFLTIYRMSGIGHFSRASRGC